MPFMYILCVDNDGTCPAQSPLTKATQFPIKRGIIVSDFFFSFLQQAYNAIAVSRQMKLLALNSSKTSR